MALDVNCNLADALGGKNFDAIFMERGICSCRGTIGTGRSCGGIPLTKRARTKFLLEVSSLLSHEPHSFAFLWAAEPGSFDKKVQAAWQAAIESAEKKFETRVPSKGRAYFYLVTVPRSQYSRMKNKDSFYPIGIYITHEPLLNIEPHVSSPGNFAVPDELFWGDVGNVDDFSKRAAR